MCHFSKWSFFVLLLSLIQACGGNEFGEASVEEPICELALEELPYATEVVRFSPGENGGYGDNEFPGVVLGFFKGSGGENGSLHVLSLGVGGEIILSFGSRKIINGDGPDFVVFENPFAIGGDASNPFAEFAEVSVSVDGQEWTTFGCDKSGAYPWPGCAGWQLVKDFEGCSMQIQSDLTGGDLFDLQDIGLQEAQFVRIVDLAESGGAPSAGFDLDAVGIFYFAD